MHDTRVIIGKAIIKAEFIPTSEIMESIFDFEQREHGIFYFYTFRNSNNDLIAGRSHLVSNKLLNEENKLQKAFEHALYNINNFLANRKRIFKVVESRLVSNI